VGWRTANSLLQLRKQIDALAPERSKISDGTIGNTEHAVRASDHNPWVRDETNTRMGIVTALDITNDPAHHIVSDDIAKALIRSKDERIKYVISNGTITSGSDGPSPWVGRQYDGKNPHNHHVHISVKPKKEHYDSVNPWVVFVKIDEPPDEEGKCPKGRPVLSRGSKGKDVEALQNLLAARGSKIISDAVFGFKTEDAVKSFQRKEGLIKDGIVGPYTWEKLVT
jgi:Putative peptidoglycan binding domain